MSRKPRLHVPGGLYHVILRGNSRQAVFFDADDRRRWESLIASCLDEHGHRLHAYCWMTNHVHMAIQCHERPLGGFMRTVASQYARATNKKLNRTGHLFERRHRAILVQDDAYLQQLIRYIHMNPVRAGVVVKIADYPWCSHHAYLNGAAPDWLTVDWVLSTFGSSVTAARLAYAEFMDDDVLPAEWDKIRGGSEDDHRILGDDDFIATMEDTVPAADAQQTLPELVRFYCKMHDVTEAELQSPSRERRYAAIRAEISLAAIDGRIATNAELARYFGRTPSGLSRTINRLRRRCK